MLIIFGIIESSNQKEYPMAFVSNTSQQIMLADSTFNLTEREKFFSKNHGQKFLLTESFRQ